MASRRQMSTTPSGPGFAFCFEPRPPFQPPRLREVAADRIESFRRWLAAEVGLAAHARVAVTEWVSFDPRDTPHVTAVAVVAGAHQLAFSVAKRLDAIERADLPARLWQVAASPRERHPWHRRGAVSSRRRETVQMQWRAAGAEQPR